MTQVDTLTLGLAYVLPLALLALLVATARRPRRWLSILVLAVLPIFYAGHFFLLQGIQGWPVDSVPPDGFRLLGFDVREPDPDSDGEILIWVQNNGQTSPRAHRLPYSRKLHRTIEAAGQRLAQGTPQIGTRSHAAQSNDPTGDASGGVLSFYDERPRKLPAKGDEEQ